jgi:hypothetical protein
LAWLIKKNEKLYLRKEREKKIYWIIVRQKRVCIFSAEDVAKNVWERSDERKEKQKGLIAKINANNLCQRKLF